MAAHCSKVHSQCRNDAKTARKFATKNRPFLELLGPSAAIATCLQAEEGASDTGVVKAAISELVGCGAIFKRLFGGQIAALLELEVADMIQAAIRGLLATPVITRPLVLEKKRKIVADIRDLPGFLQMPSTRRVLCWYRGLSFKLTVSTIEQEFDYQWAAAAKENAYLRGLLTPLFCEEQLFPVRGRPELEPHFPPEDQAEWEEAFSDKC